MFRRGRGRGWMLCGGRFCARRECGRARRRFRRGSVICGRWVRLWSLPATRVGIGRIRSWRRRICGARGTLWRESPAGSGTRSCWGRFLPLLRGEIGGWFSRVSEVLRLSEKNGDENGAELGRDAVSSPRGLTGGIIAPNCENSSTNAKKILSPPLVVPCRSQVPLGNASRQAPLGESPHDSGRGVRREGKPIGVQTRYREGIPDIFIPPTPNWQMPESCAGGMKIPE